MQSDGLHSFGLDSDSADGSLTRAGRSLLCSRPHSPEDIELFFDEGEIFVAASERGFASGGEGGGETSRNLVCIAI